jgi:hypothetical protein
VMHAVLTGEDRLGSSSSSSSSSNTHSIHVVLFYM